MEEARWEIWCGGSISEADEEDEELCALFILLGLLLSPPYDHLTPPARILFNADGQGVPLIDPQVFPHILGNRHPPTDADCDIGIVEGTKDGHSASSCFVPEPHKLSKSAMALKRVAVAGVLHCES